MTQVLQVISDQVIILFFVVGSVPNIWDKDVASICVQMQTLIARSCLIRLESYGEASMVLEFARAQAAKRARGLAHVLLCLEVRVT
jgi:hypothetical protein